MKLSHLLFLLLVVAAGCTGRPAADATGEEIYLQLCSNCHGDDLGGGVGPALGSGSPAAEHPDTFLEASIVDGRGRMPSFRSSLDDDQLGRLIRYIREVQGR
ncbi:MAG: cytochrome c [Acidimicrobiia bacterium]